MSVPGERRAVRMTASLTTGAAMAIAVATFTAWDAPEAAALVALVASVVALALACAGLAAYTLWLRQTVSRRMVMLLRSYLEPRTAPALPDEAARTNPGLVLLATTAAG